MSSGLRSLKCSIQQAARDVNQLCNERRPLMKHSRNTLILMLAIFLLLGSLPVAAVERPLALHGEGHLTMVSPTDGTLAASGTATHLGQWTQTGTISFTSTEDPNVLLATGEVTFTAANGDTLHSTF